MKTKILIILYITFVSFSVWSIDDLGNSLFPKKRHFLCSIKESVDGKNEPKSESVIVSMTGSTARYSIKNSESFLTFSISPTNNKKQFTFNATESHMKIAHSQFIHKNDKKFNFSVSGKTTKGYSLGFDIICNKVRYKQLIFDREGESVVTTNVPQLDGNGYQMSQCYKKLLKSQSDTYKDYKKETDTYFKLLDPFRKNGLYPSNSEEPEYDRSFDNIVYAANYELQGSKEPLANSNIMKITKLVNKDKNLNLSWEQVREYLRFGIKENQFCKGLGNKHRAKPVSRYIIKLAKDEIKLKRQSSGVSSHGRGFGKTGQSSGGKNQNSKVIVPE